MSKYSGFGTRAMTTLRACCSIVVIAIVVSACGGGNGGSTSTEATTVTPPVTTLASAQIQRDTGGTITVPATARALQGASVTIPAGALNEVTEDISIDADSQLPGAFTAAQVADLDPIAVSQTVVLTRSGTRTMDLPAEVVLPYDKATVGTEGIPLVMYWNPKRSLYEPVALTALDRTAGTVTFKTAHFSSFVIIVLKKLNGLLGTTPPLLDTGFKTPTVNSANDGFFIQNFGAYDAPGGSCFGMANYSVWYYDNKRKASESNLGSLFLEGDLKVDTDDQTARELASRAFIASSQYWGKKALTEQNALGDVFTGWYLYFSMRFNNEPQVLLLADKPPPFTSGHAAVISKYDPANLRFEVYDNNFPKEIVYLEWNPLTGFGAYSKNAAYSVPFKIFAFDSYHSSFAPADFEALYTDAAGGFDTSKFPKISVTTPTDVDTTGTVYTASSDTNVTLSGTVPRAANEGISVQRYAHLYLNGTPQGAGVVVANDGTFSFNIATLPNVVGTEAMILVSQDKNSFRTGFTAFKSVRLKVKGQDFFTNLGFETGSLSAWVSERHLWGGGGVVLPSDKSVVVAAGSDPIATDLPMVRFGAHALRVNNEDNNQHISSVTQSAVVPKSTNPRLRFSWAAVLEDPQHDPKDQPYVDVKVTNTTRGTVIYQKRFFANDPQYSGWLSYNGGNWKSIPWQPVDLDMRAFVGDTIQIKVEAADCALGGHGGYAYLDAEES